jgi:hypothetical protein
VELLSEMAAKGGGDICEEFSARMPIRVFNAWMNLPAELAGTLADIGRRYNIAVQSNDIESTQETSLRLYEMARAVVADRKNKPLDTSIDATSALLAARSMAAPAEMIVGTIRRCCGGHHRAHGGHRLHAVHLARDPRCRTCAPILSWRRKRSRSSCGCTRRTVALPARRTPTSGRSSATRAALWLLHRHPPADFPGG